jgi:hypothetical protein
MSTSLSVYVPNQGEIEALKAILLNDALVVGLYKVAIIPDGNTTHATLTPMPTGGSRAYAEKELTNDIVENVLTADKWYVYTNALGKGEGAYSNTPLSWVLNSYDVADANTVYGVFAYTWVLPFDAGNHIIKVGDTVTGAGGATGIVTSVCVQSGTWASNAAGYLNIKTKTGTWVENEAISVSAQASAVVNIGTAGDALKRLMAVWPYATGVEITLAGQTITFDMKLALATGT